MAKKYLDILVNDRIIKAEIGDSLLTKAIGLMGRKQNKIAPMLFVFNRPSKPVFWTFGMLVPIDMIFISNGEIKEIHKNIPPSNFKNGFKIIKPKEKINMVLELAKGESERINIYDKIIINGK